MLKRIQTCINSFLSSHTAPWMLAALFHFLAALYSFGYHHPDEHYQILEWARFWLQNTLGANLDPSYLPWEHAAQIRPWFQPFLHIVGIKVALIFDGYNPFTHAFIYRLIYAFLNLWSLHQLWMACIQNPKLEISATLKKWGPWILATTWFLPYLHVRTSSENLSTILLTFTFAELMKLKPRAIKVGLLFGFAFLARYQIALGLVGLGIYWLVRDRGLRAHHLKIFLSFISVVILGVLIDRIGYGTWVFTPYRYFTVNLVQGVAATFNPYPWYQYFIWIFELYPFISIPLLWGVILYFKKNKWNEWTSFCATFCLAHGLMTNKEYRFLFPIIHLLVLMAVFGWTKFYQKTWFSFNLPAFSVSALRAAAYAFWPAFAIHHYSEPNQSWITNHDSFKGHFYEIKEPVNYTKFATADDFEVLFKQSPRPIWVEWDEAPFKPPFEGIYEILQNNCDRQGGTLPEWIFQYRKTIPAVAKLPYQAVYKCSN